MKTQWTRQNKDFDLLLISGGVMLFVAMFFYSVGNRAIVKLGNVNPPVENAYDKQFEAQKKELDATRPSEPVFSSDQIKEQKIILDKTRPSQPVFSPDELEKQKIEMDQTRPQ